MVCVDWCVIKKTLQSIVTTLDGFFLVFWPTTTTGERDGCGAYIYIVRRDIYIDAHTMSRILTRRS